MKASTVFSLCLLTASSALAGDGLDAPQILGPRVRRSVECPIEKATAVFDSRLSEIRVSLDGFALDAGGPSRTQATAIEKRCLIRMTLQVPAHKSLKIYRGLFREALTLPPGSEAELSAHVHRVGEEGQRFTKKTGAPDSGPDTRVNKFVGEILNSHCGENVELDLDLSARLSNPGNAVPAHLGLTQKDLRETLDQNTVTSEGAAAVLYTELSDCEE